MARESILVVEDDRIIAMELRSRLQRWGFTVPATAATGEDAVALTLKHQPHLVLMDIWLQGSMDGIQAAEQIHRSVDTPIVYVTANADESTLERAKKTEPYGYVLKPFEELELRTTIEIALYKHSLGSRLKESEQWLSTTLTSIGDAVVATDEAGTVTFINPVAVDLLRVGRDEVLGKNLGEVFRIIDESTHKAERDPASEVLADGHVHQPNYQPLLLARDGTEIPIYYNVAPIRDGKGKLQGVVLVFRDITERKRAERLQSTLYRIADAVTSASDLNALYAKVHTIIADLLPGKEFYLALCDMEKSTISFPYFVDQCDGEIHKDILPARPFGRGITEFVIRTGTTLLLSQGTILTLAAHKEIDIIGTLPFFWLGTPLRTAAGEIIGVVAVQTYAEGTQYTKQDKEDLEFVSTQIAVAIERKRAEQVLRESEERFRAIFARSAIGIAITDLNSQRILESNDALQLMLGFEGTELRGKTIASVSSPPSSGQEGLAVPPSLLSGEMDHIVQENGFLRKDGNTVWGRATISVVRDPHGQPLFGITLIEDITQRKESEEKIRQQAALLDHAQDAISVRDLESRITYWNKGAERLYGWSREEVLGMNEFELLLKEFQPELSRAQKEVLTTGEWDGELIQKGKSGEEIVVQSRWTLVRDDLGEPHSVLVINTNMTDRRKLEAQFLRAQRLESIGTLAGGIAHDLNNVLSPIMLASHLLRTKTDDPTMRKWIDTMEASAQRGAGILSQVLTFARGSAGKRMTLQPKHLLKEMTKIVSETFPRSIETVLELGEELWTITGDPTQLHQVLMNLCVNARDAMPSGGVLTIRGENVTVTEAEARQQVNALPGPYILLSIKDTGTGIPPKILEKVFEPFFTTKDLGHGTGLGLSTVHAIVKGHRGFVRVETEVGKGTEFRIYIPADRVLALPGNDGRPDDVISGKGERILVIDDERMILNVMEEILGGNGYQVVTASSGTEGVAILARDARKVDAVLVDLMMPQMDGISTIKAIRKINPNARIMALSGIPRDGGDDPVRPLVQHFLAKPFTAQGLLKSLREQVLAA